MKTFGQDEKEIISSLYLALMVSGIELQMDDILIQKILSKKQKQENSHNQNLGNLKIYGVKYPLNFNLSYWVTFS